MAKKTFVQFLLDRGYEANSFIHEHTKEELIIINGQTIRTKDLDKTQYASLQKLYLFNPKY